MKLYAQGNFGSNLNAIGVPLSPAYLFRGSTANVLFDAGVSAMGPSYVDSLEQILGNSQELHYLFITHSHWDHCGAMPYLKRSIPQMKIGACHTIPELFKKESVIRKIQLYNDMIQEESNVECNDDVRFEMVNFDLLLKDGETIDLGNAHCTVYEAPGHTRDSLAYYIPELEMLFPGEALGIPGGEDGSGVQVEFLTSYDDYLTSILKLAALKPRIICLGHEWVFTDDDAAEYFETSYGETIAYRNLIEQYLHETNGDVGMAVEVMVRKEYDEKGTIAQPRFAYVANLAAQVSHIADIITG